ncbi:unnamed protein product [Mesocestoides corti]|nr:unnamed protein product [Mesocestoides corti]
MGKTSQMIDAIGSGIWCGVTSVVSLGVDAICSGVSAGESVVSGVASYLPFPRRSTPDVKPQQRASGVSEKTPSEASKPAAPAKPGLLPKALFRTSTKDKAD